MAYASVSTPVLTGFKAGIGLVIVLDQVPKLLGIHITKQATAHPRVSVIGRKRGADVLRPLSPEHPDDETFEGLLIVRPEGRLFFVNAQNVREQVAALVAEHQPRVLALDLSRVPDIEYSALQTLMEDEQRMSERGIVVWLAALNPGVLEVVRQAGFHRRLGRARLLFNAREAIEHYRSLPAAGQPKSATA